jgi:YVTN family beta-propeller protein
MVMRLPIPNLLSAGFAWVLLAMNAPVCASDRPFAVVEHFAVGGEGGWDYPSIDAGTHLLYIARANRVLVVDTSRGQIVSEIADTPGVHGIALARDLKRGYISCGQANVVKVFDLESRAIVATIQTGDGPDAIVYEPITQRVFAFNGRGHSATVIDARTNAVTATIALGGKPEFSRVDGRGNLFVNIEDTAELARIDARAASVTGRWPLAHCEQPTGLALDAIHRRGFSTCGNQTLVIMNLDSGEAVATLPIGKGVDGAEFDADTQTLFSANGEGNLSIVRESSPERYAVAQTLVTQRGARTIALDPGTHRLYLPTAQLAPPAAATADNPHPRPVPLPGTFVVLVVQQQ